MYPMYTVMVTAEDYSETELCQLADCRNHFSLSLWAALGECGGHTKHGEQRIQHYNNNSRCFFTTKKLALGKPCV